MRLNRDEYAHLLSTARFSKVASWLSMAAMSACVGGAGYIAAFPEAKHELAKALVPIGMMSSVAGILSSKVSQDTQYILQDYQDISVQQRNNRYFKEMTPIVHLGADDEELVPFNWQLLKYKFDQYPHLAILGATGEGKTVLAEFLVFHVLNDAITVVVDPHYAAGKWSQADVIVANRAGMYEGINLTTAPIPFEAVLEGRVNPTIPEFAYAVWAEMEDRLSLDEKGRLRGQSKQTINVVYDEYNAYAKTKNLGKLEERKLREARKAKIRNLYIFQNADAGSCGFDDPAVRSNIHFIRVGDSAKKYAEHSLTNRASNDPEAKEYWTKVLKAFKKDLIPCLVEDEYAVIPYITK